MWVSAAAAERSILCAVRDESSRAGESEGEELECMSGVSMMCLGKSSLFALVPPGVSVAVECGREEPRLTLREGKAGEGVEEEREGESSSESAGRGVEGEEESVILVVEVDWMCNSVLSEEATREERRSRGEEWSGVEFTVV